MLRAFPALLVGFLCGVVASCTGRVPAPCTPCNGVCVDKNVDSANCGQCGQKCAAGSVCAGGTCVANCPAAQSACNGGCFDLSIDPRHCGRCGNACQAGCVDGGCAAPAGCGALSECNGRCVDTAVDPSNCGGCGVSCDGGFCRNSACALCAGGATACGGRCVDTSVDPSNCGRCGGSCDGGICRNGTCALCSGEGLRECGSRCVDTAVDPSNCGGCGVSCDGGYCVGASCRALCGAGTAPCNGRCVVTDTDVSNCGGCGVVCTAGPNATAACSMGRCSLSCAAGRFDCDGVAANGCESFADCIVPISVLANGLLPNDLPVAGVGTVGILNGFDVSADGRRVAFATASNGIAATDVNNRVDYFVRDLTTGVTTSLTHSVQGRAPLLPEVVMSANGEVVLFTSPLDLTGQGADGAVFVYAWMASTGRFVRVVDSNSHDEYDLDISDDGQRIVFISSATNLAPVGGQRYRGWLKTLDGGFTMLFDPSPAPSWAPDAGCPFVGVGHTKISGDGEIASISTNARLTANDVNSSFDVFVRPVDGGIIELVSLQTDGGPTQSQVCSSSGSGTDINGDGSVVTFYGNDPLVPGAAPTLNVFARRAPATFLISSGPLSAAYPSVDRAGLRFTYWEAPVCMFAEVTGTSVTRTRLAGQCERARISGGGRAVAFLSKDHLVPDAGIDGGGYNLFLKYLP